MSTTISVNLSKKVCSDIRSVESASSSFNIYTIKSDIVCDFLSRLFYTSNKNIVHIHNNKKDIKAQYRLVNKILSMSGSSYIDYFLAYCIRFSHLKIKNSISDSEILNSFFSNEVLEYIFKVKNEIDDEFSRGFIFGGTVEFPASRRATREKGKRIITITYGFINYKIYYTRKNNNIILVDDIIRINEKI